MNAKFTLAIIALVGIGVFALPSTMSLFSGQHSFYNIDATGNQIPCQKCHGDVQAELGGQTAMAGSKAPHAAFKCEYCHRSEAGFASGDDAYATVEYANPDKSVVFRLATTLSNFERGNFPKVIDATSSTTVDNWNTTNNVFQLDGVTPFIDIAELRENGSYAGSLPTIPTAGIYKFVEGRESALRTSAGVPSTGLVEGAFDPRAITTWTSLTAPNLTGNGASATTPGSTYHAASLVSCMECHGGEQEKGAPGYEVIRSTPYNHKTLIGGSCGDCHPGSSNEVMERVGFNAAGGFANATGIGLTTGNASEGSVEAHNEFVTANGNGVLRGPGTGYGANNIACVSCHTHVAVDINFQKAYQVKFDAVSTGEGSWNVGNFTTVGHVNISVYGNQSGLTYATGDKSYSWSGATNMYVNGATTTANIALNDESSDSLGALTSP